MIRTNVNRFGVSHKRDSSTVNAFKGVAQSLKPQTDVHLIFCSPLFRPADCNKAKRKCVIALAHSQLQLAEALYINMCYIKSVHLHFMFLRAHFYMYMHYL